MIYRKMLSFGGKGMIRMGMKGRNFGSCNQYSYATMLFLALLFPLVAYPATPQRSDAFPITVRHKFGTTTIVQEPDRVVTFGWNTEDALIALGKIPAGMPFRHYFPSGIFPWNEKSVAGFHPFLFEDGTIDFEQIALLKPDLILAVNSYVDATQYEKLSRIAPTIVREGPTGGDWREDIKFAGMILGRQIIAQDVIRSTEDFIAALRREHRDLDGLGVTHGMFWPSRGSLLLYNPDSSRQQIFRLLGMRSSKRLEEIFYGRSGTEILSLSLEMLPLIDSDIVALWLQPQARGELADTKLIQNMLVVKQGRLVLLDDPVLIWFPTAVSTQSIRYALPEVARRLTQAASKIGPRP
ncbi:hypothetical protein ASF69_07660 [Rhizobium sp. Leaf311]|uniref:ABC transporter substrate-binding protein n=1 Tax=Rhizobium sp. Leaf311 TaxID=1736332 RepID=UPI000714B19F|nr:ABC transporter substrate-binding protein [Rhizobium sp. Leaf311]KQQ46065.1 hypothetical protein ASF69_07660 [Rhizobium sp. Leaf311]